MTGDRSDFKFLRSQSETSVFKFLWRSLDGKHLIYFLREISVFKFLQRSQCGWKAIGAFS